MSNIDAVFSACSYTYERGVIIIVMGVLSEAKNVVFEGKSGKAHILITIFIYHISGISFSEQDSESLAGTP
ncbi:MAG TPA: hypothetical protein O0W87_05070 [Methanocorpusculum sp.]|nr:hypothetical protein [Methanocorpusculum sp.]HJJ51065.1 hypothetical protein [Methanocorpusculum sp.]